MPSTWRMYSQEVYGKVVEKTPAREHYVVVTLFDRWLKEGKTEAQLALRWNAGGAKQCSSGVNKYGVAYDSCAYVKKVLARL